jgi:hypothetical protein
MTFYLRKNDVNVKDEKRRIRSRIRIWIRIHWSEARIYNTAGMYRVLYLRYCSYGTERY